MNEKYHSRLLPFVVKYSMSLLIQIARSFVKNTARTDRPFLDDGFSAFYLLLYGVRSIAILLEVVEEEVAAAAAAVEFVEKEMICSDYSRVAREILKQQV